MLCSNPQSQFIPILLCFTVHNFSTPSPEHVCVEKVAFIVQRENHYIA